MSAPEYPTDLDLNSEKDIHLDTTGDLTLTSGIEQLQQSVAIDVMDELDEFIGGRVTGKNIGLLEERLRQALNDDPQLSDVQNVNVEEYNRRTNTLTVTILTIENDEFTLPIPVGDS
jgi:hypothetical protein